MNRVIKSLLYIIIIALLFFIYSRTTDKDGEIVDRLTTEESTDDIGDLDEERLYIVEGYKAVRMESDVVQSSGIRFEELTSKSYRPNFSAYAEVLDILPLVSSRTDYLNLIAEKKTLQNDLYNRNKMLKRAESLHKTQGISTTELEKIRTERDLKTSELNTMQIRIDNLEYTIRSNWGEVIGKLVIDQEKKSDFDQLASHQSFLVLLSLLKHQTLSDPDQPVFISHVNDRDLAVKAKYIDIAIQTRNPVYGENYIYQLNSPKLSTGMRLFAWIEENSEQEDGIFIPDEAVIWYANEPWIYIKQDDLFIRKPLGEARKIKNGWLLKEGISTDDLVVISGSQTLLSEEFKWAIPDEEDD